ncbi:MAG: DNA/RNA nuclease SfsA [Tissierellaceae bacterium]|nr:DNA/RNA nuclease SfsA [Tissierellaceae bacterium]
MRYKKMIEGVFLKRPNRFIAHVLINGIEEIAHVKNTGRCAELLIPGAKILLEDASDNPNRKTKYSLISVWKGDMLVNMDSQVPNAVVAHALKENKIEGFKDLVKVKREVTFGQSRYDIYFETHGEKGFIEVKGVTLEKDGIAMFPDAPTERGSKHALEMVKAIEEGYTGIIFFLIQMKGPGSFRLNSEMDQKFSESVKYAVNNGVRVLVYDSIVGKETIEIGKPIEFIP